MRKPAKKALDKKYVVIPGLLAVALVLLVGGISFLGDNSSNIITTSLGTEPSPLQRLTPALRSVPGLGSGAGQALFDVTLTIPQNSVSLSPGEELLLSVELTNFGLEPTEADLTYIISRAQGGEIVYIEHEKRPVEQEDHFLKTIALQDLPFGIYKVYVHVLYANGTATGTASGEFNAEWK